ncbi:MAG TPA: hopanoid biosynthesis-associated protein HpnK [Caulobacteraceae bacterium]
MVITADDFGVAVAVNQAVETAHRDGVLTAASLMVGAAASSDAVDRARRLPSLRVGLHLVLADGRPVLPAGAVPHLVGKDGCFRPGMAAAGATMFFHPSARRELAAEIEAQFRAFQATGLALDHVNAHKHFHLHPTVAGLVIRIGARFGARAVRVPIEPRDPLRGAGRKGAMPIFGALTKLTRARFRRAGWCAPDQVFGLRWSGAITQPRLERLIRALPSGLSEIYLHPAIADDFVGAADGYRYREELAALTDLDVRETLNKTGARMGGFVDFLER